MTITYQANWLCPSCGNYRGEIHACPTTVTPTSTVTTGTWYYPFPNPNYVSFNKNIGVEPWPEEESKPSVSEKSGFAKFRQKVTLKGLKVLIGNKDYPQGSTVFVNADHYVAAWAQRVFDVDGIRFVLMPTDLIEFVRYAEPPKQE